MKKIIKPALNEECLYFSDFTGKPLGDVYPPVVLTIDFSYGSLQDGKLLEFHLDDDDISDVLEFLKCKIVAEKKIELEEQI
jgi:hypothetical protein